MGQQMDNGDRILTLSSMLTGAAGDEEFAADAAGGGEESFAATAHRTLNGDQLSSGGTYFRTEHMSSN